MTPEHLHRVRPAQRDTEQAEGSQLLDRVVDGRFGAVADLSSGFAGAPGKVGVLTSRVRVARVETAELREELARIEHVAGLVEGSGFTHLDRTSERTGSVELARKWLRSALHRIADEAAVRGKALFEPRGARLAVVVGKRDQRSARQAPTLLAGDRRPLASRTFDRVKAQVAAALFATQARACFVGRRVVHHHYLEGICRERLATKGVEQRPQSPWTVARGHHDAYERT